MLHLAHPLQCKRCQRWFVRYQWISRAGAPQQHIATYCNTSTHIGKKWQNLVQLKSGGKTTRCIAPFDVKVVQRCSCWDAGYGLAELLGSHASSSTLNKFDAHATLRIRIGVSACTGTSWFQMCQDNTTCMNTCSSQTQSTCNTCKLLSAWKHDGKPSINQGSQPCLSASPVACPVLAIDCSLPRHSWLRHALAQFARGPIAHHPPDETARICKCGAFWENKWFTNSIGGNIWQSPTTLTREKTKHCLSFLIIAQYQSSLSLMYVWQFETWNLQI